MGLVIMSDVRPERVSWLWEPYLPAGKLTLLDGNGGIGKTTLALALSANLSRGGPLPDGTRCAPMSSLLLTVEDGLGDTIRPRLDAAGADLERVGALPTIAKVIEDRRGNIETIETLPLLPDDVGAIAEAAMRLPPPLGLIVIDPILNYLGEGLNAHKDQDIRRGLTPLIALAEQTGAAVLLLRHLNKAIGGEAIHRGQGGMAFLNMCRSALLVAPDPDDEGRAILAQTKANLAPRSPSLIFRLEGQPNGAAVVRWEGQSSHTANTLVARPPDEAREGVGEAGEFLETLLAAGPLQSRVVQQQAREAGISNYALTQAKRHLGIRPAKEPSANGAWIWSLPATSSPPSISSTPSTPSISWRQDWENERDQSDEAREEIEHVEEIEGVEGGGGAIFDNVPLALRKGLGFTCAICGRPTEFLLVGKPLLCKAHRAEWDARQQAAD